MLSFRSLQRGENLDRPQQPTLFDPEKYETKPPRAPKQTCFEPPSDIVVYAYCEGQVVVIAQQTTGIEDVAPRRPLFIRYRRGTHPKWQAMRMASYIHEKSEAGKIGYRPYDEIEV